MVEAAAEHEVARPRFRRGSRQSCSHEQQAGAADRGRAGRSDEDNDAEGDAPDADESKEG